MEISLNRKALRVEDIFELSKWGLILNTWLIDDSTAKVQEKTARIRSGIVNMNYYSILYTIQDINKF